jgi:hypothetical protein
MKTYCVTVKFERKNPIMGTLEKSERSGTVEANSKDEAKKIYLKRFKANEPTRRKIESVRVTII